MSNIEWWMIDGAVGLIVLVAVLRGAIKGVGDTILKIICIIGGIGSSVAAYASQKGYCIKVKSLGIPDKFITHGTTAQQYGICSMTVDDIVNTVISSN